MENMKRLLEFRRPRTGKLVTFKAKQYYVTSDGMVYDGNRKRYLKQYENKGYMAVDLRDDNGQRHTGIGVHRLVATCFLRLLEKGETVHHIDKNRKKNNLSNLEILTASEHQRQHNLENWQNGTFDAAHEKTMNVGNSYCHAKQVAQLSLDGRLIKVWPSTAQCHRNGYDRRNVFSCCNGKRKHKTYKGFKWMWLEDFQKKQKEERRELETLASN